MRALLAGALAATLAGCNCLLPPQASIEGCTDANRYVCFDRASASQLLEVEPASFKTHSAALEIRPAIARVAEKLSPVPAHVSMRTANSTATPAKAEPAASPVPLPPPSPKTRGLQPAPAADAEQVTVARAATQPKADSLVRSIQVAAVLRGNGGETAAASPSEPPAGSAQKQPAHTAWVVSETTSPVDYSPLVIAMIPSTSSASDGPSTLAVRCPGARTELQLRTEGAWHASRGGEVQVDHQINDQPLVRQHWTLSADGKTARYKGDAIGLLRSLPEGARLKLSVVDREGHGQETTFQLTGLDSVRNKIGLACKWPS